MELYVDGQVRQVPEGTGPGLGDLLAALRDELAAGQLVITTVKLDGEELMPAAEDETSAREFAEFGKVEIITATAAEWGRHGLGEAASALGQLADEVRKIADLLRGGERPDAIERFEGVVGAYGQLVQALVTAAALANVSAPEGFEAGVEAVTDAMRGMPPALKSEDAVAAADLAEYELAEQLDKLAAMVKGMGGT